MAHPPLLGIRHVALVVADLPAAERFWTGAMGYEVEWRPDADNVYLHGPAGAHDNLALHHGPARRPSDGSGQLDHVGIGVPSAGDVDAWAGLVGPAGMPQDIIDRLRNEVGAILESKDFADRLAKAGSGEPYITSLDEFKARIRRDFDRYGPIVKAAGVQVQ